MTAAVLSEDKRMRFVVYKRSRRGWKGKRQLYLDDREAHQPVIQLYDADGRLRKEYPLHLLSQLDMSPTLDTSLSLHFHAQGDVQGLAPPSNLVAGSSRNMILSSPTAASQTADVKQTGLSASLADNSVLHIDFETPQMLQDFVAKCQEVVQEMQHLARISTDSPPTPRRQASAELRAVSPKAPSVGVLKSFAEGWRRKASERAASRQASSDLASTTYSTPSHMSGRGADSTQQAPQGQSKDERELYGTAAELYRGNLLLEARIATLSRQLQAQGTLLEQILHKLNTPK
jgi:hypothetical protein